MSVEIRNDPGSAYLIDKMGDANRVLEAARVSIGGQKPKSTDAQLLRYLWENGHTSPFEHVTFTFRIECPIFTARQIMRHRTFSYNEISGRYSELGLGYYLPKEWYPQSEENKQGSAPWALEQPAHRNMVSRELIEEIDAEYRQLLEEGVSREQARMILPVSTFTSFYMTGNFLNWVKFLKLRYDDHAQYEVWRIAEDIVSQISETFPTLWDVIKEDIGATPRQMAHSRHLDRAFREGGISKPSGETPRSTPAHSEKVFEAVRSVDEDWSAEGEA